MYPYRFPVSQEIIQGIEEAIQDERNDSIFYEKVSEMAKSPNEKRLISEISMDEKGHIKLFKQLYKQMTGRDFTPTQEPVRVSERYLDNIEKGILGESEAVRSYNKIYAMLADMNYRSVLSKIIHDELRHLGVFNYLYSKHMHMMHTTPEHDHHRVDGLDLYSYRNFTRNSYFRNENEQPIENVKPPQKEIPLEELPKYDGKDGRPAYIAVNGIVYDVSKENTWNLDINWELPGGRDLTIEFQANSEMSKLLGLLNKVGVLKE
jgi:rubrerythrin/predicted heme/steroid binding protein